MLGENCGGDEESIREVREAVSRIRIPWRDQVLRYCLRATKRLRPRAIILHGSVSRGDWDSGSDVDLIIVSEHLPVDTLKALEAVSKLRVDEWRVDALGFHPTVFEEMLDRLVPLAVGAVFEGIPILGYGYFMKLKRTMRERGISIKPTEFGWELIKRGTSL